VGPPISKMRSSRTSKDAPQPNEGQKLRAQMHLVYCVPETDPVPQNGEYYLGIFYTNFHTNSRCIYIGNVSYS
jgi:hypothetical protein